MRCHLDDAAADLDLRVWLGAQIQGPGVGPFEPGVHVADNQAVAVAEVEQGNRARLPRAASDRRQQQNGGTTG
jgi:hypothetical protein